VIYNGAVDNAGGIATMLEAARLISSSGGAKRSVVFFATAAEEKGLPTNEQVRRPELSRPLEKRV
jgi:Zn-dependent M28 family amino/carboxypeptidase